MYRWIQFLKIEKIPRPSWNTEMRVNYSNFLDIELWKTTRVDLHELRESLNALPVNYSHFLDI